MKFKRTMENISMENGKLNISPQNVSFVGL